MPEKIAIVTDSTSDISPEAAAQSGINVVPLTVRFGSQSFTDRVDIDSATFFQMLGENAEPPSTSLPSPGDFIEKYEKLLKSHDVLISIHISSKLSGTYQSACTAARNFPEGKILTIDSGLVASSLMLVVVRAARRIMKGIEQAKAVEEIKKDCEKGKIFFIVDTLEYLQRGGRIGKSGQMVGSMLSIKPILTVRNGSIGTETKVRTKKKAISRVIDIISERQVAPEIAAVGHAAAPDEVDAVVKSLRKVYPELEIIRTEIGPVIGTHSGPGCIEISVV